MYYLNDQPISTTKQKVSGFEEGGEKDLGWWWKEGLCACQPQTKQTRLRCLLPVQERSRTGDPKPRDLIDTSMRGQPILEDMEVGDHRLFLEREALSWVGKKQTSKATPNIGSKQRGPFSQAIENPAEQL